MKFELPEFTLIQDGIISPEFLDLMTNNQYDVIELTPENRDQFKIVLTAQQWQAIQDSFRVLVERIQELESQGWKKY
jgi:hypothetical protein